ncbi:MAG: hypothetical protein RhofKO_27140 [Rhodothermales bacterium]
MLYGGCTDFVRIQAQTGLTRGNLPSHMSKLEAAGYLGMKKDFKLKKPRTLPYLTDKVRKALKQLLTLLSSIS